MTYFIETSDNQVVEISEDALAMSDMLSAYVHFYENMERAGGEPNQKRTINLKELNGKTVKKIVEYCEKFKDKKDMASDYHQLSEEETEFFDVDFKELAQFANAVDYLRVERALKHVCICIERKFIWLKSSEEIKEIFFTDSKEEDLVLQMENVTL
uniref:Skp1_POZ domain-containing protein n=1 Tax=Steinernema glaseri TaxID=37863 RepID=A0A1I7ZUR0_9BILA